MFAAQMQQFRSESFSWDHFNLCDIHKHTAIFNVSKWKVTIYFFWHLTKVEQLFGIVTPLNRKFSSNRDFLLHLISLKYTLYFLHIFTMFLIQEEKEIRARIYCTQRTIVKVRANWDKDSPNILNAEQYEIDCPSKIEASIETFFASWSNRKLIVMLLLF